MPHAKRKRVSEEVDKLIAEVDKLTSHPDFRKRLSVNRACQEVGLQPTVYYFRKRKEDAMSKLPNTTPTINVSSAINNSNKNSNRNKNEIIAEIRRLEEQLLQLKIQYADASLKETWI